MVNKKESKTRQPVQERGVRTKKSIIKAARELFEEKGYHGTNSKEIAARAGVAVGTFYIYYDEKKPLFLEVIREYYREIRERVLLYGAPIIASQGPVMHGDLKRIIHDLIQLLYKAHTLSPALHREIAAMIYGDREVEAVTREEDNAIRSLIREFLAGMSAWLAVKDLDAAVHLMHRSAEETIHGMRIFESDISDFRILAELEDMLYRYLFSRE